MKTLLVGDLHLKQKFVLPCVDHALAENPDFGRVVFLGDACDDWGAGEYQELEALEFYAQWVERHREQGLVVDVLLGNHDFCYIRGKRGPGSLMSICRDLRRILEERLRVQVACAVGPYLCSHAGVTEVWAQKHLSSFFEEGQTAGAGVDCPSKAEAIARRLNEMLANSDYWAALDSCSPSRGGWFLPGPLWADLRDLITNPLPGLAQVVGHTPVFEVENAAGFLKHCSAEHLWACDTFSLTSTGMPIGDGSMLLIDENDKAQGIPFPVSGAHAYEDVARAYWETRLMC